MARPRKYQSATVKMSFRIPEHIMRELDRDAEKLNLPRAEVALQVLIDKYGDKPVKKSVFD